MIKLLPKFKKIINKIVKFINKVNALDRKYHITPLSAASSYYIIIALFSIIFLVYQIYGLYSKNIENFLLSKVLEIINPVYHSIISDNLSFSFNTFSAVILFNLLWSGSKIINNLNNFADTVYIDVKRRKSYLKRISAFLMFMMMLFIAFFLIAFVVYTNNLIIDLFYNTFILRIIQFIIEIVSIYFTLMLLFMYAPPIKMQVKDVTMGTAIATAGIYVMIILFLLLFSLYNEFNIAISIITIISTSFLLLYGMNIIINLGIIINYHKNKYGNIF